MKKTLLVGLFLLITFPFISFGQQTKAPKPTTFRDFFKGIEGQLKNKYQDQEIKLSLAASPAVVDSKQCVLIKGNITIGDRKFKVNCQNGDEFNNAIKALANKNFWKLKEGDIATAFYKSPILRQSIMEATTGGKDTHSLMVIKGGQRTLEAREIKKVGVIQILKDGLLVRLRGEGMVDYVGKNGHSQLEDVKFINLWVIKRKNPLTETQSQALNNYADRIKGLPFAKIAMLEEPLGNSILDNKFVYGNTPEEVIKKASRIYSSYYCAQAVIQSTIVSGLIEPQRIPTGRKRRVKIGVGKYRYEDVYEYKLPNPLHCAPYDLRSDFDVWSEDGGFLTDGWEKPKEVVKCILPDNRDKDDINFILLGD